MKKQYEIKYCNISIINHEYLSNKYLNANHSHVHFLQSVTRVNK